MLQNKYCVVINYKNFFDNSCKNNLKTLKYDYIMGIDLICGDESFGCSYTSWNNIRNSLIEATFEYLEVHFAVTEYEEGTHEQGSMIALKQYIQKIRNLGKNEKLIVNFIVY